MLTKILKFKPYDERIKFFLYAIGLCAIEEVHRQTYRRQKIFPPVSYTHLTIVQRPDQLLAPLDKDMVCAIHGKLRDKGDVYKRQVIYYVQS